MNQLLNQGDKVIRSVSNGDLDRVIAVERVTPKRAYLPDGVVLDREVSETGRLFEIGGNYGTGYWRRVPMWRLATAEGIAAVEEAKVRRDASLEVGRLLEKAGLVAQNAPTEPLQKLREALQEFVKM